MLEGLFLFKDFYGERNEIIRVSVCFVGRSVGPHLAMLKVESGVTIVIRYVRLL